jgi:tellurite resistance protein
MTEPLDDDDLEILARAPCWVFVLVAAADGTVDAKERKRLRELLGRTDAFATPWMRDAIGRASERLDPILDALDAEPKRAVPDLTRVADLAEQHLPAEQAHELKHDLLAFAKAIAQASGGGVLGLGNKIDWKEELVIGRLASILRFSAEGPER